MIPTANEIFDENKTIHQKNIQEAENRKIDNWLKRIDKNLDFQEDLKTLYMACNESNRIIKIIVHYIIKKWNWNETQRIKRLTQINQTNLNKLIEETKK